ncbi:Histidine kinase/HSP90-like ATPase superfamily [Sesbania bispinosa]|nr:Histidine kinase/HSP90-like ATPase superfamily [Sesbania bispinosa]
MAGDIITEVKGTMRFCCSTRCPAWGELQPYKEWYVPAHLHAMVFELVKNSLHVVQECFMDSDKVAPPVRIIVADGIEDVTIKVVN